MLVFSLLCRRFLVSVVVLLAYFCFHCLLLWSQIQKAIDKTNIKNLKISEDLINTFMSLIYFELIFVYGVREGSSFILFPGQPIFRAFIEETLFPHCIFLIPLSYINWLFLHRFISIFCPSTYVFSMPVPYCFAYYSFVIQFQFQPQRKAMPKNVQTTIQLHSFHMLAK